MPKLMLRIPPAARIRSVGGPNFHTPERERLRQLGEELRQLFLQNKRDVLNSLGLEAEDLVKGQELFDTRIHEMDTTYLGIIDLMANSEGNQKRVIAKLEESFAKLDRALDEIAGPATERITQRLEETVTLGYDDLDKGASERYSRIIETLRAIDGLEGTSCNLGVAISPSLRDDIRAILDPGNMEHMLNVGKCALREYMSGIRCYMDEEVRTHIRTFIDRFLGIAKEFISEKEWTKTACFKAICYTHAKKSANVHAMYEQRMDTVLGKSMLASEAGLCPYLLFFDTQVLDEAAEIVRGIKTDRTARAVMENQRWITTRRFEELKELTGLLDVFAVKKESCDFELVGGLMLAKPR